MAREQQPKPGAEHPRPHAQFQLFAHQRQVVIAVPGDCRDFDPSHRRSCLASLHQPGVTGEKGGAPVRSAFSPLDQTTGIWAAFGILARA